MRVLGAGSRVAASQCSSARDDKGEQEDRLEDMADRAEAEESEAQG